jgi:CubicO group peptidase (beta-lactamase class C family)
VFTLRRNRRSRCPEKRNDWTQKGYVATLISVTGSGSDLVFAGTFEKRSANVWLCKFGLTDGPENNAGSLAFYNKWAIQNGCILHSASIYGTVSNKRYAGIWLPNPEGVKWACRASETAGSYQTWFDAYTKIPFRLGYADISEDQLYLSIFRDDSVGEWVARHGMTSSGYQAEFDKQVAKGFFPICVHGGGKGSDTRYAAIFARQAEPSDRQWTITGNAVASLSEFDKAVKNFMQANAVRAGTLAIAKNGKLAFARAYTWAEPGYPITQPDSFFRLASCSKAFVCAAIQKCYDAKLIKPSSPVFPLLEITSAALPSQKPHPKINAITVKNLVDHAGGWDHTAANFDAVFANRQIALSLGLPGAPTKRDLARYMYGEPLQFDPGTNSQYSNFGYVLLGLVVEQVTGKSFTDFVRQSVLAPLGINDVFLARTRREQRREREVTYDDPGLGVTALDPHSNELLPACYGGGGYLTETMDSGGGLCATTTALVQFINKNAAWGIGDRNPGSARSGGMAGTASLMVSRWDGVDYAYAFNTRKFPADALKAFDEKLAKLLDTTTIP